MGEDATAVKPWSFTGQQLDPESGLYYYGGRYYDPDLGRFISPDPFVGQPDDPQNLNRYSYVVNNPVNYIDPDGYFHQVKKKKKKGGFFGKFFGIFQIVIGAVGVFFGVPPIVIGEINFAPLFGFLNIAQGATSLALESRGGGLGARGPPFGGEPGDFGLLSTMAGNDHPSPALDFWRLTSSAVQIAQQLGGDRSSGSGRGSVDYGPFTVSNPVLRERLDIFAEQIDRPVIIKGGDRDPDLNRRVGEDRGRC